MKLISKNLIIVAGLAAGLISLGLGSGAASASSGHQSSGSDVQVSTSPGDMRLATSPDEKVDTDGTQGNFESAIQGTVDNDNDQDSFAIGSFEATPQKW